MDWFSWLSKTNLDPSLVYEYGVILAQNELEEIDIPYFDHDFLQSMGISIAKHRLEILKLARKVKVTKFPRPLSRILMAINRTKRFISKYVGRWMHRKESAALALVPSHNHSAPWRNAMVKRSKRLAVVNRPIKPPLLITNGSPYKVLSTPRVDGFWGSLLDEIDGGEDGEKEDECRWSSAVEETRWDKMFDNLKPT